MNLAQCAEDYIEYRRRYGYAYTSTAKVIRRFYRHMGRIEIKRVTGKHQTEFLRAAPISNNTWRIYAWHLERFFLYCSGHRWIRQVPKPEMKPAVASTFYPYVYTRQEIRRLVDSVESCEQRPRCIIRPQTLATLILFLYGTGMKVGDALALLETDVNLVKRTTRVRANSVFQSRIIPIGGDVTRLLRKHLKRPEREAFGPGLHLFVTKKGEPIRYGVVCGAFQRLRRIAGIHRLNSSYQPRVHDLRHTFAVHSIEQGRRKGLRPDKLLPLLSTYMGSVDMHGMQKYLALSPATFRTQLSRLDC